MCILLQKQLGRLAQFALFGCGDAFQAATEKIVFSKANFNKDQHIFIAHDEVNFSMAATKIAIDQF